MGAAQSLMGAGLLSPGLYLGGLSSIGASGEIDFQGKDAGTFDPDFLTAHFIDSAGDAGALLDVCYGDLAAGKMIIRRDCGGFQADQTFLDFHHWALSSRDANTRIVLAIEIQNSVVSGFLGAYAGGTSMGVPGTRITLHDENLLPILFGRSYHGLDTTQLVGWTNELSGGELHLSTGFWILPPDGPVIVGGLALYDEAFSFGATSAIAGAGLETTVAEIQRTPKGLLTARLPDLELSKDWKGRGFSGNVTARWVDGSFEASGRLDFKYPASKPRLTGSVNVLFTTLEKAWAAARSHDPAPQITGGIEPEQLTTGHALTGWGVLNLEVAKNLNATASFVVDPDGYVTARGSLRTKRAITLFDAVTIDMKTLKDRFKLPWDTHWKWDVGKEPIFLGVDAKLSVVVDLEPKVVFGPVTLRDAVITGFYSTRPHTGSQIDVAGSINASAEASLTASAALEGSVNLGDFSIPNPLSDWIGPDEIDVNLKAISVDVGLKGVGAIGGYIDTRPQITRTTAADPATDEADYTISGHVEAGGAFKVGLYATGDFDFFGFWKPSGSVQLGSGSYPIGGGAIAFDFSATTGNNPDLTNVSFSKPSFDPHKFVSDLRNDDTPTGVRDKKRGQYKDRGSGKTSGLADAPRAASPEPKADYELEVPFQVEQQSHKLWLVLGPPPRVDVASGRERLSERLFTAMQRVEYRIPWEQDPSNRALLEQQVRDLEALVKAAINLENDAKHLGADTTELFEAEIPGLEDLAADIAEYGATYDDPNLDGSSNVGTQPIEAPVGKEEEVEPTTQIPVPDREVLEHLANHGFTYDPATGIASKTKDGRSHTVRLIDDRWTYFVDGVQIAQEYQIILYKHAPSGHFGFFNAHHAIQDAWAKTRLGSLPKSALYSESRRYRGGDEPTIMLRNSYTGSPHRRISNRQEKREATIPQRTYKAERAEVLLDLQEANVPTDVIGELLALEDAYFQLLHDNIKDATVRTDIFEDYFQ